MTAPIERPHTHEVVIVRPDDGRARRWATYPDRQGAEAERAKLVRQGFYAVIRRLAREVAR